MSKLFNLGSKRPSTIGKRRLTGDFDDDIWDSSQANFMEVKAEPMDTSPVQKKPSSSPSPQHRNLSPPPRDPSPSPRNPSSPPLRIRSPPPKQTTSAALQDPLSNNYETFLPPKPNYQYLSSQNYMQQTDNMVPQPYFVTKQAQISETEYSMMKEKTFYLEEKVAQLKCSLDIEKERNHGLLSHKRHGPERRLDELQQLFLKREHAQEQIYGLLQDKYQDRLERFFSKEEMNRTIGNNNNNNSDGLNDQTEQLKSAIKSLEARLLKSETERINNYKKYEMAQAKGTLQSGFTSIHIINVDDQEDRVHYMCSIKKTDGTLYFTLSYPKDEADEAEYIPQLNYKQQNAMFIAKLDQNLKCKMSFERNALPGLLQLLLQENT